MRRCNWLVVSILAVLCVAFYLGWREPRKRRQEFCRSVRVELSTLGRGKRATPPLLSFAFHAGVPRSPAIHRITVRAKGRGDVCGVGLFGHW